MLELKEEALPNMRFINSVFERLAESYDNVELFDPTAAPQFVPDIRGNGIFKEDAVHFTPEVNNWVAESILDKYLSEH